MPAHSGSPRRNRALKIGAISTALCATALAVPAAVQATNSSDGQQPREEALDESLAAVTDAGIYGVYSAANEGDESWQGASGVADVETELPTQSDMPHRVASVTKSFVAVAILQQVDAGTIELDAPAATYLPADTLPPELAEQVTVRMLLNHTSGIGDYILGAFPSLEEGSADSLDEHRYRQIPEEELIALGLAAPAPGAPGELHSYSNTNYVLAGWVLEQVTGVTAEQYITEQVIEGAGLENTAFPETPRIEGPHSRMYESFYGLLDPPRDYSEYDMSWTDVAGSLVSTMDDLNLFYAALFGGELLPQEQLDEMMETVPQLDEQGEVIGAYGLGLYPLDLPCGTVWGHDGVVWGASTMAFSSPDGESQVSIGANLMRYQEINEDGTIEPHPADIAVAEHLIGALCGTEDIPEPEGDEDIPLPQLNDRLTINGQ